MKQLRIPMPRSPEDWDATLALVRDPVGRAVAYVRMLDSEDQMMRRLLDEPVAVWQEYSNTWQRV